MVVCSVHVRHGSAAKGSAEAPVGKTHSNGANIRAALAAIAAGAPGRRAIAGEAPEEEAAAEFAAAPAGGSAVGILAVGDWNGAAAWRQSHAGLECPAAPSASSSSSSSSSSASPSAAAAAAAASSSSSSFRVGLAGAPREATAYDWGGRGSDDEAGEDGDDGDDDRPFYAGISIDGAAWLVPTATPEQRRSLACSVIPRAPYPL